MSRSLRVPPYIEVEIASPASCALMDSRNGGVFSSTRPTCRPAFRTSEMAERTASSSVAASRAKPILKTLFEHPNVPSSQPASYKSLAICPTESSNSSSESNSKTWSRSVRISSNQWVMCVSQDLANVLQHTMSLNNRPDESFRLLVKAMTVSDALLEVSCMDIGVSRCRVNGNVAAFPRAEWTTKFAPRMSTLVLNDLPAQ